MEGYITKLDFWVREYRNFNTIGIANKVFNKAIEGPFYIFDSCINERSPNITTDLKWIGFVMKNENCSLVNEIIKVTDAGALATLYPADDWEMDIFNLPNLNIGIDDVTFGFIQNHNVLGITILKNNVNKMFNNLSIIIIFGFLAVFIGFFIGKLYRIFVIKYIQYKKMNKYLKLTKYVKSEDDEDESCTICLDTFQRSEIIRTLICKHIFHQKCIDEWIKKTERCPNCNQNIYDGDTTPLLLRPSMY
jgi:hypothetical protein